jgi:hypothetical protein
MSDLEKEIKKIVSEMLTALTLQMGYEIAHPPDKSHITEVSEDEYRMARTQFVMPVYGGFNTAAPMHVQAPGRLYQISASQQPALLEFLEWVNEVVARGFQVDLLLGEISREYQLSPNVQSALYYRRHKWAEILGFPPPERAAKQNSSLTDPE